MSAALLSLRSVSQICPATVSHLHPAETSATAAIGRVLPPKTESDPWPASIPFAVSSSEIIVLPTSQGSVPPVERSSQITACIL